MNSEPWYEDGLRFECTACGNCCTGAPGVVWVNDDEIRQIADYLGKSTGEIRLFHTKLEQGKTTLTEFANGDCTFFDGQTRNCKVYPVRPRQCRTWPFWRSNLATREAWDATEKVCPGAGRGSLISLEEIERRRTEIDI